MVKKQEFLHFDCRIFPHNPCNLCYTVSMQTAVSEKSSHFFSIPLDIKATAHIISQIRRFARGSYVKNLTAQIPKTQPKSSNTSPCWLSLCFARSVSMGFLFIYAVVERSRNHNSRQVISTMRLVFATKFQASYAASTMTATIGGQNYGN